MNMIDYERKLLINKILDQREKYWREFLTDPDYVVIPLHYSELIPFDKYSSSGYYDTYYGMHVIESKNCKTIDDIMVY